MEGGSVFGDCHDMISLFESTNNPLWVPSSSSSFHETMMNFNQEPQQAGRAISKRSRGDGSFARTSDGEDTGEDEFEINLHHQSEKKRRLSSEQVKFLEKSFEVENKLEPERKVELAKQLGLQPRQVAIWFQNRRARYKTKQIEKEFDSLKDNYERLKVDYETLNKEKENLQNEVEALTKKLAEKEEKEINSNLDTIQHFDERTLEMGTHGKVDEDGSGVLAIPSTKQAEDASSAKSDVFDSESPPCTDANQNSALLIEASSALMRDLDQQSDFSQDEEEHLMMNTNLLLPQTPPIFNNFLKLAEDVNNYDPNAASCNISLVDDQPFWSWLY